MREKLHERLVTREHLLGLRKKWREEGLRVVFTNGVFDLLHVGHVQYLAEARNLGDLLILGLNSDTSVQFYKGPKRPLVSQEDRAKVLLSLRQVDFVTIYDEYTAEESVRALQPDIYVKGGDYSLASTIPTDKPFKLLPEENIVRSYGGTIHIIPYLSGHSTTALIEKILKVYG